MRYFKIFISLVLVLKTSMIFGQQSKEKLKFSEKFNFEHEINSEYSTVYQFDSELLITGKSLQIGSHEKIQTISVDTPGQECGLLVQNSNYLNNWPSNATIAGTYFYEIRIHDHKKEYKGYINILR